MRATAGYPAFEAYRRRRLRAGEALYLIVASVLHVGELVLVPIGTNRQRPYHKFSREQRKRYTDRSLRPIFGVRMLPFRHVPGFPNHSIR